MVRGEREMVRKLEEDESADKRASSLERATSLQPTYEDSVPNERDEWAYETE